MEVPALHRMLSYNRQGSRNGAEPRFVAAGSSSRYIEKISCILCILSVQLQIRPKKMSHYWCDQPANLDHPWCLDVKQAFYEGPPVSELTFL